MTHLNKIQLYKYTNLVNVYLLGRNYRTDNRINILHINILNTTQNTVLFYYIRIRQLLLFIYYIIVCFTIFCGFMYRKYAYDGINIGTALLSAILSTQ